MLSSKARWKVGFSDPSFTLALQERLNIRPLLAVLLAARGISAEEAEFFLSAQPEFHDPFLLDGMELAVKRIERAIRDGEYIRIYGDYDADGVSSTSLMVRLLRIMNARFDCYIPHRVTEGYGLNIPAIEHARKDGVDLLVTVDTGISAVEQVERARELGLDVIVTDHHEPPEVLPNALAIINPKKPSCGYPFKGLAGVGVAFKLAQALLKRLPEELAEFAALGTIADLMPLTGENRSIVTLGLERMRSSGYVGFQALFQVSGIAPKELSAGQVAFAIAPRVNASGRLEHADEAVRLFTTDEANEAESLAKRLDELNRERQAVVEETAKEAIAQVEASNESQHTIIVSSPSWNPGVIGIVASKLVEKYYKPSIVISIDEASGIGKGSARAVPGFHLYDALVSCSDSLEHFGGHEAAAGLSVHVDQLDEFRGRFDAYAAEKLTPEMKVPTLAADAQISLSDVTVANIAELNKLAPYGMANPTPKFVLRGTIAARASTMGKDSKHGKLILRDERTGEELDAVAFGMGELTPYIGSGSRIDVLGELSINEWRGRQTPQLIVRDLFIGHKQLFDWRDAATEMELNAKWAQWKLDERRAAILIGERSAATPFDTRRYADVPVYMLRTSGECVPINSAALEYGIESHTDIVLATAPFPIGPFRHILEQCTSLERIYAAFGGRQASARRCDRAALGAVYTAMRAEACATREELASALASGARMREEQVRFALQVFLELQLIEEGGGGQLSVSEQSQKRDLMDSPTYRLEAEAEKAADYWAQVPTETLRRRLLEPASPDEDMDTIDSINQTEAIS